MFCLQDEVLCYQTLVIPASLSVSPGHLANATTDLMKLDHEEEPQLSEPYLSKQKKLMVSESNPHTFLVLGEHDPQSCHGHLMLCVPASIYSPF